MPVSAVARRKLLGGALAFNPSIRLGFPGVLVLHCEQHRYSFHIVGLQFTHEPLVGDSLAERHDDSGRRDAGNCVAYLAETLDVLAQCFAFMLADGEEVTASSGSSK